MKLYLDVCCLNRPFDDTSQLRVAMEAMAVERLLALGDAGRIEIWSSEMAQIEVERIRDLDRRNKVRALLPPKSRTIALSEAILHEGEQFVAIGFALADAIHLAAAAQLKVDAFVTTDDRLRRRAVRKSTEVSVRAVGPAELIEELEHGDDR